MQDRPPHEDEKQALAEEFARYVETIEDATTYAPRDDEPGPLDLAEEAVRWCAGEKAALVEEIASYVEDVFVESLAAEIRRRWGS